MPVCAYLTGQYGIQNMYFGVTAELGKNGVERVVEMPLEPEERAQLDRSAKKVKQGIDELEGLVLA